MTCRGPPGRVHGDMHARGEPAIPTAVHLPRRPGPPHQTPWVGLWMRVGIESCAPGGPPMQPPPRGTPCSPLRRAPRQILQSFGSASANEGGGGRGAGRRAPGIARWLSGTTQVHAVPAPPSRTSFESWPLDGAVRNGGGLSTRSEVYGMGGDGAHRARVDHPTSHRGSAPAAQSNIDTGMVVTISASIHHILANRGTMMMTPC